MAFLNDNAYTMLVRPKVEYDAAGTLTPRNSYNRLKWYRDTPPNTSVTTTPEMQSHHNVAPTRMA